MNCNIREAVACPLVAALISGSDITITGVDCTGSQGDDAIVPLLQSVGADIEIVHNNPNDKSTGDLVVRGSKSKRLVVKDNEPLRVNISGFPDAVCALAVISCFIEGTVILEDTGVCRKKETDRIKVMCSELQKCGADITDGLTLNQTNCHYGDCLIINGHAPLLEDGTMNSKFTIHGATIESYDDHRVAMSMACLGLGIDDNKNANNTQDSIRVKNAECCAVSFPKFFEVMNKIGADFQEI